MTSRSLMTPQARAGAVQRTGLPVPRSTLKRSREESHLGSTESIISGEDDLTKTRRENRALHFQIQMLKTQAEKNSLGWERSKSELEEVIREAKRRAEVAERDRAFLLDQAKNQSRNKSDEEDDEEQADKSKVAELELQLGKIRKELSLQKERSHDLLEEKRALASSLQALQQSSDSALKSLDHKMRQLESSLTLQMALVEQKDRTLAEVQTRADELEREVTTLRQEHVDSGNVSIIRNELTRQVTHLRSLESTNRRLLREMAQMKVEQGQYESIKDSHAQMIVKCSNLDHVQARLNEAEITIANLNCEKEAWSCYLQKREDSALDTPKKITQKLALVRGDLEDAQQIATSSNERLESKDRTIDQLENDIRTLTVDLHESRQLVKKLMEKSKRLEKQRQLGVQECKVLRDQIATFDQESSVDGPRDMQSANRVEALEKLLEEYRAALNADPSAGATTEVKLDVISSETAAQLRKDNKLLQDEILSGRRKVELLQVEVGSLEKQLGIMQKAIGSGAYDHQTTKVLSMADNPAARDIAIRSETLQRLKRENAELLKTIDEMYKTHEPGPAEIQTGLDLVPRSTVENLQRESSQLHEALATKDKRLQRLIEVYKEKSKEFRQAVKSLLGYKMEFLENGRVRLYSAFAQSGLSLTFTPPTAGGADGSGLGAMELTRVVQEGEEAVHGAEGLDNLRRFWVNERQCIPGFLASLTLELFEQTTRGQAAGWVG